MTGLPSRPARSAASGSTACGLVGVRDQVDDEIERAERRDLGPREIEQRQRVGVVAGVLEQIFGRRVAGERRIEREHAEIRRRFDRAPADQRLDLRGRGIGRRATASIAVLLPDGADPVEALGVARIERRRLAEMIERGFDLVQLEAGLAELMLHGAVVRPLSAPVPSAAPWRHPSCRSRSAPAPDWCATANATHWS